MSCPKTKESLNLEITKQNPDGTIEEGFLVAVNNHFCYPIIKGVPRFVEKEHYSESFGYEWNKWAYVQYEQNNLHSPMEGYTEKMFNNICQLSDEEFRNKLVVEFGCGGGRFIDIVRRKGGRIVGIDMSSAVEQANEFYKNDPDVLIVQADILNPPFIDNCFDIGYTIGVLHHTPDPFLGFQKLFNIIKINGTLICSVYPKNGFYDFKSVYRFRKFIHLTQKIFRNYIALIYSYFSAGLLFHLFSSLTRLPGGKKITKYLEMNVFPVLYTPSLMWRVLDIFDAITPKYASTHSVDEIVSWFRETGCREIKKTNWGDSAFKGIK